LSCEFEDNWTSFLMFFKTQSATAEWYRKNFAVQEKKNINLNLPALDSIYESNIQMWIRKEIKHVELSFNLLA
jgi:hypothetical protein